MLMGNFFKYEDNASYGSKLALTMEAKFAYLLGISKSS